MSARKKAYCWISGVVFTAALILLQPAESTATDMTDNPCQGVPDGWQCEQRNMRNTLSCVIEFGGENCPLGVGECEETPFGGGSS